MIYSLESTLDTFKSVRFRPGLNLIVVDKEPASSAGQTRNSAGKTSIVELIHYVLGGDADPENLPRQELLKQESFSLRLDVCGLEVVATRSTSVKKVYVDADGWEGFPIPPKEEKNTALRYLANVAWKRVLGHCFFGMPLDSEGTDHDRKRSPAFRSCFSYFARRRESGGFLHPERHAEQQQRYDYQTNLSYLLGLDWRIPWEMEGVREQERNLRELVKTAKQGAFSEILEKAAELRPKVTSAQRRADRLRGQLDRFEVHESYKELSREAAQLRERLRDLATDLVLAKERGEHLVRALEEDSVSTKLDVRDIYSAVGVQLPGVAVRRFEDAKEFYASVRANREQHLRDETVSVRDNVARTENEVAAVDARRSEILRTLKGKGALDDFLSLQKDLAAAETLAASLSRRLELAERLEGSETELLVERGSLQRRLQRDHSERLDRTENVVGFVSYVIERLYDDREGGVVIESTPNGPEFRISIEGDRGGGIANMEIFCMDLGLVHALGERGQGPGFLIHDSHLFDGVDNRQVARAIEIGAEVCGRFGWQYIVMLNSDIFDTLPFSDEFDAKAALLPLQLSDRTESGGLFGQRF